MICSPGASQQLRRAPGCPAAGKDGCARHKTIGSQGSRMVMSATTFPGAVGSPIRSCAGPADFRATSPKKSPGGRRPAARSPPGPCLRRPGRAVHQPARGGATDRWTGRGGPPDLLAGPGRITEPSARGRGPDPLRPDSPGERLHHMKTQLVFDRPKRRSAAEFAGRLRGSGLTVRITDCLTRHSYPASPVGRAPR